MSSLNSRAPRAGTPAGERITFSLVVPVYNNQGSLGGVIERVEHLAQALPGPLETVYVVDGSPDGSLLLLRKLLQDSAYPAQLISLSRNFGSFAAIRVGMAAAGGDFVGVMSADLQEPEELVRDMFLGLYEGGHDIVAGVRTARHDSVLSAILARTFWMLYRRFVQRDIPPGGVDVFACTSEVSRQVLAMEESHSSLLGLMYWIGFRRSEVPYVRLPRTEGKSSWSIKRRVRYMSDSVFSFTDLPITALVLCGALGVVATLTGSVFVLAAWLIGRIHVSGYTPLMLVLLLSTSAVLLGLGIVGSYVWRTYENSKERPGAIPMSQECFGPSCELPSAGENSAS